ncbi:PREDICTED: uncharacterized protein LOC101300749 [Fragaria vesca subsp. vesca]
MAIQHGWQNLEVESDCAILVAALNNQGSDMVEGGDEAVIQLLLKTNLDVNDADAEGNTALHWILKQPRLLCPQQIKILSLLLDHGARVSQRNRLGLTAFHIAAGNGNSEALEVLLLEDPVDVQYKMEMKETPLFFAVKNDSKECVELLLTWGANSEVLNLRQRAIDLATSQDMHYTILNPTTVSLINHAFPNQHKCTALVLTDEDTTTTTERHLLMHVYIFTLIIVLMFLLPVNARNLNSSTKAEVCKYFDSHRGCVREAKCFYAHCEEESRKVKERVDQSYSPSTKLLKHKVFVGGLPPSVDSDDLGKFCEEEFEKMSPQCDQEQNFQLLQQKSNENIMEVDNPEQGSWADILVHGQPTVCSTGPQVTKSSEDPRTPTWLKVFKKWFPGFLKGLSKHPNYALSSLKADFQAKFALELDHSSVGHSKLSDFLLKCFSNICTVEMCPTCKRGNPPTHMILRPKVSRPKHRLLPTLGTPHNLSLSALIVNGGDSMCVSDLSSCDGGDSKCLQNLSVDNGGDSKYIQNLTIDTCSDTKCFQDLTADNTVDSKCLEDLSVHGTTCIGWVAEEFVILAADSRATLDGKILTDTRDKFKILTPLIVATHAGASSETSHTCEYMERQMSDDIRTGKDVNSIWRLGELCKERELSDKENICHILIGGIQDEVPRCCSVYNIKGSSGSDWVKWKVMGSGGRYIRKMLEGLYKKLGDKASWNDVVNGVGYLMLVAALADPSTGGIISVQKVQKMRKTNIHICLSVIELIIKFYTTQLSYILADGVKEETRMSFQQTEGRMIFLFYKCNEINSVELETWLSIEREEKIKNYGHPLTELADGYHAHCVEFKSCKSRDKFFRGAQTLNQEITLQFTSRREFFKFYALENHTIFVACQTLDMLKSLELSEKMKGKNLIRKTS